MAFKDVYDSIVISPRQTSANKRCRLIYYITGNPGIISYYDYFLNLIHEYCEGNDQPDTYIYGCTLAGFENAGSKHAKSTPKPLLNLDQEIEYIENALATAINEVNDQRKAISTAASGIDVVLMGHSLGTFIAMEILRRRRPLPSSIDVQITGGILLTPTVMDLAGSPKGRKARIFSAIPYFAEIASTIAKAFLWPIPDFILGWIIRHIAKMPEHMVPGAFQFLRGPNGIHQALHLLKYELAQMTADKWDDEIWGVAKVEGKGEKKATKLFFYFVDNDSWIANETRDRIIATRAFSGKVGEDNKPHMEIDRSGIPHGFCVHHNEPVAKKTFEYLQELAKAA